MIGAWLESVRFPAAGESAVAMALDGTAAAKDSVAAAGTRIFDRLITAAMAESVSVPAAGDLVRAPEIEGASAVSVNIAATGALISAMISAGA